MQYVGKVGISWLLRLFFPLLIFGIGAECCAFDWPLSPEAVREAYFFGKGSDRAKVAKFLGQYEQMPQPQDKNSSAGRIELHTPYQRVVQRAWESTTNYSVQQAQIDFASQSDIVRVRVFLYLAAGGPAPGGPARRPPLPVLRNTCHGRRHPGRQDMRGRAVGSPGAQSLQRPRRE